MSRDTCERCLGTSQMCPRGETLHRTRLSSVAKQVARARAARPPLRGGASSRRRSSGPARNGGPRRGGSPPWRCGQGGSQMGTVTVRYIVDDVDASIDFYCRCLGFSEQMHPAPTFAMLLRGDLRLVLSAPSGRGGGGGGQSMPEGTPPSPGGGKQFSPEGSDLEGTLKSFRPAGGHLRHENIH